MGCWHDRSMASRVPPFTVWAQKDEPLSDEQERFYRRFRAGVLAGESVDVEKNDGYTTMFRSECVGAFDVDPDLALDMIGKLRATCPETELLKAEECEAHMRLLRGEWHQGYELARVDDQLHLMLGLPEHVGHPRLRAWSVWKYSGYFRTNAGMAMIDDVMSELQSHLDRFHDEHPTNVIQHFWSLLHRPTVSAEDVAQDVYGFLGPDMTVDDTAELIRWARENYRPTRIVAFRQFPEHERVIPTPAPLAFPEWYGWVWRSFTRTLVRDAENRARQSAGLPEVGGGWVSEKRLLNELRAAFPEEAIHHQVRPLWLRPQSLDMVFAGRNVAVEYQGVQHSRPVDYFGGEDAFLNQQLRDGNKRALCRTHGMTLIEVFPGYDLDDVVATVREALENQSGTVLPNRLHS